MESLYICFLDRSSKIVLVLVMFLIVLAVVVILRLVVVVVAVTAAASETMLSVAASLQLTCFSVCFSVHFYVHVFLHKAGTRATLQALLWMSFLWITFERGCSCSCQVFFFALKSEQVSPQRPMRCSDCSLTKTI